MSMKNKITLACEINSVKFTVFIMLLLYLLLITAVAHSYSDAYCEITHVLKELYAYQKKKFTTFKVI